MKTLPTKWAFYDLPEKERLAMIGQPFMESQGRSRSVYFPVDLHPDEFNYEAPQGLIFVTEIFPNDGMQNWFRVGVCSPDDLDKDLDFDSPESPQHRAQAIEFLSDPTNLRGVFYDDVLNMIQELVGAGTRTS